MLNLFLWKQSFMQKSARKFVWSCVATANETCSFMHMVAEMLQKEFLCDIKIYSIQLNIFTYQNIYLFSQNKFMFNKIYLYDIKMCFYSI